MEIEVLHARYGDKQRKINTSTEKGRQEAAIFINRLFKQRVAIFLERPTKSGQTKTYRVKQYDPSSDSLIVEAEVRGATREVKARGSKSKTTAVAPVAGGQS